MRQGEVVQQGLEDRELRLQRGSGGRAQGGAVRGVVRGQRGAVREGREPDAAGAGGGHFRRRFEVQRLEERRGHDGGGVEIRNCKEQSIFVL